MHSFSSEAILYIHIAKRAAIQKTKGVHKNTMEQKMFKNAAEYYKTTAKEFLEELGLALKDYFECTVQQENDALFVTLNNGQNFCLSVNKA